MKEKDILAFMQNSEQFVNHIDEKGFKDYFTSIVNHFKGQGMSTPASILAVIGWIWFADQGEVKKDFTHIFVCDGNPVLMILGDANGESPLGYKVDFDFFEKIGYSKRDMLDAGKLFEMTKYAADNNIDI